MRSFGYGLGVGLLVAGAAAVLGEHLGGPSTISLGWIWAQISANSLVGFQSLIENRVATWLWPPIQSVLTAPIWLILVPPGLVLVFACRRRSRPADE